MRKNAAEVESSLLALFKKENYSYNFFEVKDSYRERKFSIYRS